MMLCKQTLTIFLIFLSLSLVQLLTTNKLIQNNGQAKFIRRGLRTINDIGAYKDHVWACGKDGKVYKHAPGKGDLSVILPKSLSGCKRISVDSNGSPWVVTTEREIYQLKVVNQNSIIWKKVPGCAIDIGCGYKSSCYVLGCDYELDKGGSTIWAFNQNGKPGFTQLDSISRGSKIALGRGIGGVIVYIVTSKGKLKKRENGTLVTLAKHAIDLAVDSQNNLYYTSEDGAYRYKDDDSFQVASFGRKIAAGDHIWLIGEDHLVYRGNLQ